MQNDSIRCGNIIIIWGGARVLGGQPRHCIFTNASRGLSAIAEFLVLKTLQTFSCFGRYCGPIWMSPLQLATSSSKLLKLVTWSIVRPDIINGGGSCLCSGPDVTSFVCLTLIIII